MRSLLLVLAGAAGVHFYHVGLPDWMEESSRGSVNADQPASSQTSFDFYKLLPKTVVAVGEPAPPPPKKAPPARRPPTRTTPALSASLRTSPAPATPTPATPPPVTPPAASPTPREPAASAAAPAASLQGARYRIQTGSFREKGEADRLRASLILEGMDSHIRTTRTASGTWHRVMVGPYDDRTAAERVNARLRASRGLDGRIVREGG